ncbi:MAG: hypothetical protein KKF16_02810 [Euryarchaeota archaeon]|nr:hypothetical protein [Euryarchaeota archaeon]MBV1730222.1 hypothetical protein [Methanobacterium sp.]MBU4547744.1 hypothetical protein [Euryarchaeota archaeon]MBU4608929.1 hypothetical protein [Euryarchaeota archaeon]MBV1755437.1 hypothetical protein [Methanobacterium sp.]
MFNWNVVLRSNDNQRYALYEYQGRNEEKIFQGNYSALTIKNGTYDSAMVAVKKADQLSVVENFKWRSFYTGIGAPYEDGQWKLTYFDIVGSYATQNNLPVYIEN